MTNPGSPYRPYPTCRHLFNRFFCPLAHADGQKGFEISAIGVQGAAGRVDCQPDGKRRVGLCRPGGATPMSDSLFVQSPRCANLFLRPSCVKPRALKLESRFGLRCTRRVLIHPPWMMDDG
eukprot:1180497-Prorocentrum_minimum.AAC.3